MHNKYKIVATVQETPNGRKLYFFRGYVEPYQVVMETGIQQCSIKRLDGAHIIYSDSSFLHPIGIIGQVCANCKFKPGNEEGGCKAYYQEKK